jgi:uncharacterized membrane protein
MLIVGVSILFLLLDWNMAFILLKPWIVPILLVYILRQFWRHDHPLLGLLLVAFFFSLNGNALIIIPVEEDIVRILALCTFIVSQICYGSLFYLSTANKPELNHYKKSVIPEICSLILIVASVIYLIPRMGDFLFPMLTYAFFGSISVLMALRRRYYMDPKSFNLVMFGFFCFFCSDVLTAYDIRFSNRYIHAFIIGFFALGHYLLLNGMMLQIKREIKEKKIPLADIF